MNKKRRLQLEEVSRSISETVKECKDIYDNPEISRTFKRAYGCTLIDRTKAALTSLSNRAEDYLSTNLKAGIEHVRTTYELAKIIRSIR